jgi:predicted alternative tryptophan synthase beta-subunit
MYFYFVVMAAINREGMLCMEDREVQGNSWGEAESEAAKMIKSVFPVRVGYTQHNFRMVLSHVSGFGLTPSLPN